MSQRHTSSKHDNDVRDHDDDDDGDDDDGNDHITHTMSYPMEKRFISFIFQFGTSLKIHLFIYICYRQNP